MAEKNTNKFTLWADLERNYFFLVPDDAELPFGEFDVYTMTGNQHWVDPWAIAPYEISREEAQTWLSGRIRETLDTAKNAVMGFLEKMRTYGHPDTPKPKWSIDLLADLMGESVEDLRASSTARQRGWLRLFYAAADLYEAVTSNNRRKMEWARAQMYDICEVLRAHGIDVNPSLEDLPDELRRVYRAAQRDQQAAQSRS
jgi:hypothetical protein